MPVYDIQRATEVYQYFSSSFNEEGATRYLKKMFGNSKTVEKVFLETIELIKNETKLIKHETKLKNLTDLKTSLEEIQNKDQTGLVKEWHLFSKQKSIEKTRTALNNAILAVNEKISTISTEIPAKEEPSIPLTEEEKKELHTTLNKYTSYLHQLVTPEDQTDKFKRLKLKNVFENLQKNLSNRLDKPFLPYLRQLEKDFTLLKGQEEQQIPTESILTYQTDPVTIHEHREALSTLIKSLQETIKSIENKKPEKENPQKDVIKFAKDLKTLRSLNEFNLEEFLGEPKFYKLYQTNKQFSQEIENFMDHFLSEQSKKKAPTERMKELNDFFEKMTAYLKEKGPKKETTQVVADEFLPLVISIILKANSPQLINEINEIALIQREIIATNLSANSLAIIEMAIQHIGDCAEKVYKEKQLEKDFGVNLKKILLLGKYAKTAPAKNKKLKHEILESKNKVIYETFRKPDFREDIKVFMDDYFSAEKRKLPPEERMKALHTFIKNLHEKHIPNDWNGDNPHRFMIALLLRAQKPQLITEINFLQKNMEIIQQKIQKEQELIGERNKNPKKWKELNAKKAEFSIIDRTLVSLEIGIEIINLEGKKIT